MLLRSNTPTSKVATLSLKSLRLDLCNFELGIANNLRTDSNNSGAQVATLEVGKTISQLIRHDTKNLREELHQLTSMAQKSTRYFNKVKNNNNKSIKSKTFRDLRVSPRGVALLAVTAMRLKSGDTLSINITGKGPNQQIRQ